MVFRVVVWLIDYCPGDDSEINSFVEVTFLGPWKCLLAFLLLVYNLVFSEEVVVCLSV
jgi:hypothetical protein